MSITRSIEVCKKDGTRINDNRWTGWKDLTLDMWISEFLFEVKDIDSSSAMSDGIAFVCPVPQAILKEMGEVLLAKNFSICPDSFEFIGDYDKSFFEVAQAIGEDCIKLANLKLADHENIIYVDAGN